MLLKNEKGKKGWTLPVALSLSLHILNCLVVKVTPAPRQDDVDVPPGVPPHQLLSDVVADLRVAAVISYLCVIVPASDWWIDFDEVL